MDGDPIPNRPARLCRFPNCPNRIAATERHCAEHKRELAARDIAHRGTASARGYDARHRRWRLFVLRRDPVCRSCGKAPSVHADHIVPLSLGGSWALSNGQGLCASCHNSKTAYEVNAARREGYEGYGVKKPEAFGLETGRAATNGQRQLKNDADQADAARNEGPEGRPDSQRLARTSAAARKSSARASGIQEAP